MKAYLGSFSSRDKVPVVGIGDPRFASVQVFDRQLVLRAELGEFGLEVLDDQTVYVLPINGNM